APALGDYQAPQDVLYDNGPLVNCAGCGAGGADESVLQSTTLLMSTLGFGHQFTVGNRIADDFTISDPDGWNIDQITFFGYQTNAPTNPSPITGVYYQIWDGPPNDPGSSVIFGDTGTNRLTNSTWANMYRVSETTQGTTGRAVFANVASAGVTLPAGTYWLDWQTDGSASYSGPWAPPITINGETTTGNAMQYTGTWGPANDGGTLTQQGFPFIIEGSVAGGGGGSFSETSNPNLDIPDDAYDGSLGSMACDTIDASSIPGGETVSNVTLSLGATHTWIGDLTVKLQSPDGNILGVFSRVGYAEPADDGQGCCGDSSNLDGTPLLFDDASGDDAETMGNTIGSSEFVCTTDGRCDYYPNPDSVVGHSSFADFNGENASGMWMLCMGDSAGGDTGVFQEWTLNIEYGGGGGGGEIPEAHMPVAVVNSGVAPDIEVSPSNLGSSQPPNTTNTVPLNIGNVGSADLTWDIFEDGNAPLEVWSDNFDSYPSNSPLHGVGGWKGWFNDPAAGANTSDAQAHSSPNSVAILGASDLVHEYSGSTSGVWNYTTWQYVPTDFTGTSYFIMLNQYDDAGTTLNWSIQVNLNGATNTITNDGLSGGSLALIKGQWVEIRVEIDLDNDTQTFFYNNQVLYSGTWTGEVSGGGILNIGAVDLFANNASVVYYDDMSLMPASDVYWSDNFDSYPSNSPLHGVGGWKGWFNDPAAGANTSDAEALSSPNSVAILGASDLVHEYDVTSGLWNYTAWQYVPTDFAGDSYFILLNQYDDAGATNNWSTQVTFQGAAGIVSNTGLSGGSLPLIKGQWVEIRVEIDLNNDTQTFFYNNQVLYSGTWTGEVSGGGILAIGAVDLFANNASVVYYDDMSLASPSGGTCSSPSDIPWVSVNPTSGMTMPGNTSVVDVTFDSTGLGAGTYNGNLCVNSNDPDTPLVIVPVSLEVVEGGALLTLDYTYYTHGGGTISGMLDFYDDGSFMDESGGMGLWQFIPSPVSIRFLYTDGSRCDALSRGFFTNTSHLQGWWFCTDGSQRWGLWDADVVTGFQNGFPTTPLGVEALPNFK
ncbi:MAG: hypothetical protein KC418_17575, partial [Anaerolineales bacterium]|nr:hypothetical protein [Anaerolineales bacterium]